MFKIKRRICSESHYFAWHYHLLLYTCNRKPTRSDHGRPSRICLGS